MHQPSAGDVATAEPSSPARLDARLVPAALTSWVVTAAGIWWPIGSVLGLVCAAGSVFGLVLWRAGHRSTRMRAIGVGVIAVGVVGAGFGFAIALRANAVARHPVAAAFGTAAEVVVTPTESALALGRGRLMFRATLQELKHDKSSGRVVVFAQGRDFSAVMVGQPMRFRARVTRPSRHDLTVAAVNAIGEPTMGHAGPVHRAAYAVRAAFAATARQVLPADQAAMLPALVLGDTSTVSTVTSQEFRTAGMTHLTAVSGANVTIVCGAVLFSSRLVGPRAAVALAGAALVLFVIVVQPTASVLRAAVMGAIALVGVLSSRRRQAIPALAATVLVLMVAAPQLAVDVGLALSVVATAALVVIAPIWSRRLVAAGWPKPLSDAVCIACAAQLVTAPLIAGISGRVSVVAAAANLAVAALIAPITVLGSAAGALCLFWPAGAQLLIRFTGPELWWVLRIAHWAAGVPAANVPVPSGVPGVLLVAGATVLAAILWRWRWFRAGMAVVAAGLLAWSLSGLLVGPAGLSAAHDTIEGVSQQVSALHLVLGDEELLVERAVAEVLRSARQRAGTDDVPVSRLRAGDVGVYELAELLSPSLFADERVVVLEAAGEAGKEAAELIANAAADIPSGTELVVVHSGGGRAKALAGQLQKLGAELHPCVRITKASERFDFVRREFRSLTVKADDDTVSALLDAVGSDIRELASACSQLVADTGGRVDVAAVRRYHGGRAEVKGFDIADKAVVGDVEGAVEALRWAMMRGEPHVVLADALAEAVHAIGRVGPLSGDHYRLAAEVGMPPWRVQKAQKQARRWSRDMVATAMRLVAALNADVKGAAADADYALEAAVRKIAELVSGDPGR